MKFILSLHPLIQFVGILLAYYAGYLGLQRARSLHFGQTVMFHRQRHAATGAVALVTLLGGFFGGHIIASRYLPEHGGGMGLHESVALIILPLLVVGIATGYYLYKQPKKQKLISAIHGLNNLIILILVLMQVYSGWHIYQKIVLQG